jgi:hypothetical protein
MEHSYNDQARAAILEAAKAEHDFGGWLAAVLACVAAELGSSDALTAERRGHGKPTSYSNWSKGRSARATSTSLITSSCRPNTRGRAPRPGRARRPDLTSPARDATTPRAQS